jgi:RNA polymerase sigma factor (sigma-70 family)
VATVAAETTTGEAQLYERHSDLVYRYCLRMLGSREDAEDATQTTFFQALRALRRGVEPAFEQAWLLTIARNECKSRHRAGSRRRLRELTRDPQTLEELAEAPEGGDGRLLGVQQALLRLPEMQRRALLLREWQGRSYREIAHDLGVSRPAVEALLFRARRGLARELGEETGTRRHAFDVASLLGALKTLLSGSAAVKAAAVGVAAVATVGTVAVGSQQGPSLAIGRSTTPVDRVATAPARSAPASPATSRSIRRGPASAPVAQRRAVVRRTTGKASAKAPRVPVPTPRTEHTSPAAPPAEAPAAHPATPPVIPVAQPPSAPPAPEPPAVPQAPQPPAVQTPQLPTLPPLPLPEVEQVQVPQVPGLPVQVPPVQLPQVPDLPIIGDIPIFP